MRILIFIALSATLSGCAEYEAREQAELQARAAQIENGEDRTCQSYGVAPGSPGYVQCRMSLQSQRAQVAANDRAIALQYLLNRR